MGLEIIKIDTIKMENPYLRLGTDVSTLERSIDTIGLISPLIVNKDNVLLAGARRWQALKNLGKEDVLVMRVDKDNLHQELISIDENLVRKPLSTPEMEQQLLRAKEIYRSLADEDLEFKEQLMTKYKMFKEQEALETPESSGPAELVNYDEADLDDVASEVFAKEVSEKSGLSEKQIKKAMEREQKAAKAVKEARGRGELSVSQTNEIIRLGEDDQEALIDHIGDRTVSELRKLVKDVKAQGVDEALRINEKAPHAREFSELLKVLKKAKKISETLSYEQIEVSGKMRNDFDKVWPELKKYMATVMGDMMGESADIEEAFHPEYMASSESQSSEFSAQ